MEILNKKNMNLTILNVINIICWSILGLFCSKINIKSLHFFTLFVIIAAIQTIGVLVGYYICMKELFHGGQYENER